MNRTRGCASDLSQIANLQNNQGQDSRIAVENCAGFQTVWVLCLARWAPLGRHDGCLLSHWMCIGRPPSSP
eukprot:7164-Heterococcus_DN1.PRE.2